MGLFDGLLSKVTQLIPDEYEDDLMSAAKEYAPQAKEVGGNLLSGIGDSLGNMFSSEPTAGRMSEAEYDAMRAPAANSEPGFWSNLFTDDPNSGWYDEMNKVDDKDLYSSKAEMEAAKLAQANTQPKSFFSGVSDFFTDDPNSGWFDEMQKNNADQALVKQAMAGMAPQVQAQSVKGSPQPQQPSFLENAYKSALGGLGGNLGALAPLIGSGVGYLASSGLRDQSQDAYNSAVNSAGTQVAMGPSASENLQDSQQDLANRALATQQIAQRASMGLTPEDIAMFEKARQQADQGFAANQAKINTDLSRRGMALSPGQILAQQQQAAQANAMRQNDAQLVQTAESFKAKQAAANSLGTMANANLQGDFSRGLAKANNQDAIARFNAEQQRARANALTQANQTQGQQLGQAAGSKAGAITEIGKGVGTAIGALKK